MRIIVTKENLVSALSKAVRASSARPTMPILSNILFEASADKLTLTATDSEITIRTWIPALVEEEGATTLPAKKMQQIVAALPNTDVTIFSDENDISTITCKKSTFKVHGIVASNYPEIKEPEYELSFSMKVLDIIRSFTKVVYARSTDDSRKQLNGVVMSIRGGIMTVAATDGRRLAIVEKNIEDENAKDGDYILPSRASTELSSCLDGTDNVVISLNRADVSFQSANTMLKTKLVEGPYPNFRQVIPENCGNTVSIPRGEFTEALKRVSLIVNDSGESVKLTFSPNNLLIYASSIETGESSESMEIAYEGEEVSVSFNPVYFTDPLKVLEADTINIEFGKQYTPIKLTGDEGFLYMLMPMKG